jgi:hypothetical protein
MIIRLQKTSPRFTMNEINMVRVVPWISALDKTSFNTNNIGYDPEMFLQKHMF